MDQSKIEFNADGSLKLPESNQSNLPNTTSIPPVNTPVDSLGDLSKGDWKEPESREALNKSIEDVRAQSKSDAPVLNVEDLIKPAHDALERALDKVAKYELTRPSLLRDLANVLKMSGGDSQQQSKTHDEIVKLLDHHLG